MAGIGRERRQWLAVTGRRVRSDGGQQADSQAARGLAVIAAAGLSRRDWAVGPVLAEEDQQADAHVDHLSHVRGPLLAADLFHRLQASLRRNGMERTAHRGRDAAW